MCVLGTARSSSAEISPVDVNVQRFTEILAERRADQLDVWIARALASSVAGVKRFAKCILEDHDAVLAALQLPWSTAQLAALG